MPFGRPPGGPQYYVATTGDNGNAGTLASPWADLSYACGQVSVPGSVIHVTAGTYTDTSLCTLAVGVEIRGVDKATTTINAGASGDYITAGSNATGPVIDGDNEISGISFDGGVTTATRAFVSYGRHGQSFHDCNVTDFSSEGIHIFGKYGHDGNGTHYIATCVGGEGTGAYCQNDRTMSNPLDDDEWATGVTVYNNTFTDAQPRFDGMDGVSFHDNTIVGTKSDTFGMGIGPNMWTKGGEIYNNSITVSTSSWDVAGMTLWQSSENVKVHDNTFNSWLSLSHNTRGNTVEALSLSVYDNNIVSAHVIGTPVAWGMELKIHDMEVYGNYLSGPDAWTKGMVVDATDEDLTNISIHHNVIFDPGPAAEGIRVAGSSATSVADDIRIYNNVIHGLATNKAAVAIVIDTAGATIDDVKIRNNVFWAARCALFFADWAGDGTDIGGTTQVLFSNNLTYQMNEADVVIAGGDTPAYTSENNTSATDPELTASGAKPSPYYTPPNATTNTVNAGVDVGLVYKGSAPDLGAYEWDE